MPIIKITTWTLVAFLSLSAFAFDTAKVQMHVGSIKMLPIKNITRIAIGKGNIVSTKIIEGKGLLLIAESPGDTELRVWREGERESRVEVEVTIDDPVKLRRNMKNLLRGFPEVSNREVNGAIILEGYASKKQLEQINAFQQNIPGMINLVKQKKIELGKMVRMDLKIVEFSKKQLQKLGIQWDNIIAGPAGGYAGALVSNDVFQVASSSANLTSNRIAQDLLQAGGPGILNNASFGSFGLISGITSQINLLLDSGDAKLLAEPRLSTRSGDTAKFLAGGEFPIPVAQGNGAVTIQFREYGIRLEIEPVADDDGNIQAKIVTELSTLDFSVASSTGIPGLLTRKTDSVINVKDGETIVLSGLVDTSVSVNSTGIPWLSEIPILGELFKSKDFQSRKTELVIFVTPHIVSPTSQKSQTHLKRAQSMIDSFKRLDNLQILD